MKDTTESAMIDLAKAHPDNLDPPDRNPGCVVYPTLGPNRKQRRAKAAERRKKAKRPTPHD